MITFGDIVFQIATATTPPFNNRVFENMNGYERSMFGFEDWVYGGMWIKRFADWNLVLYLGVEGRNDTAHVPCLYVLAMDDELKIKHRALQFSVNLNGKEYTFSLLHNGGADFALLGHNGMEMAKSLSKAKDIALRITYEDFELHMDQSQIGDISKLAEVSKNLLSKNMWRYGERDLMEMGDILSKITDDAVRAN